MQLQFVVIVIEVEKETEEQHQTEHEWTGQWLQLMDALLCITVDKRILVHRLEVLNLVV